MAIVKTDIVGKRFGKLIARRFVGLDKRSGSLWECQCDCGSTKITSRHHLLAGSAISCGCLFRRHVETFSKKHGKSLTRTYKIWIGIRRRCFRPNHVSYAYYGGRGITICERWEKSFPAFLEDMGECPKGLSIDRINNDGNYEPGNCKWATTKEQAKNRRPGIRRK